MMTMTMMMTLVSNPVEEWPRAMYFRVSDAYFQAMDIPVLAGRPFDARDASDTEPVAMISESLAERHWSSDPVGSTIALGNSDPPTMATIVAWKFAPS